MIEFKGITKRYGNKVAVNNVTFTVPDGQIFGFLGPNGAGKTTLIKTLVGLLRPDEGDVLANGISVLQQPLETKRQISYVPDNPDIYESMTGKQYIDFLISVYGVEAQQGKQAFEHYTKIFEMQDDVYDPISSYSHGMKQKIVLIGSFVVNPRILVLDEPMVGLDAKSSFTLKELMREYCNQGRTVFFSTHVMEVAEKICDQLAIIHKGNLLRTCSVEELKAENPGKDLENVFLEMTR